MTDPEKRPSQGKDVGQDPGGDHPPPAPDNMASMILPTLRPSWKTQ
jgi:hypothetical protein